MKYVIIPIMALLFIAQPLYAGKCTGSKNCTACTNCSSCKHCSKNGGSCGVCSKDTAVKSDTNKKDTTVSRYAKTGKMPD